MEKKLTADLNVVANSNLEIEYLNGDLNIIQKLDDEPNDVGGLTSAQLKAKFDESGNTIKEYINETLIPAILADDATEAARQEAEQGRVTAEQGRVSAEEARAAAETARASAESARQSAETARDSAESTRQSKEAARQTAETARDKAETARAQAEQGRSTAETARANAETARSEAETSRVTAESNRAAAEQGRTSAETTRVQNETKRVSAEEARAAAETTRQEAEQARADENTGIVARATAQANAAAGSAQTAQAAASSAEDSAETAQSAAATAGAAASTAGGAATAAAASAASVESANKTAQSWAVGGTGTREGENTNNAKYWAEQAEETAEKAGKPKAALVTLSAAAWDASTKTQTADVSALNADGTKQLIYDTPYSTDIWAYKSAGIQLTALSDGKATFTCESLPLSKVKVWVVAEEVEDVTPHYLTFSSPAAFSISVASPGWYGTMEYSTDAKTWATWDGAEISGADTAGTYKLYLRGTGNGQITGSSSAKWTLTGTNISCTGNIEYLLDYATVAAGNHPTMWGSCYADMFSGCTSLTTAPALPATELTSECYSFMFANCTGLTVAPELPATKLASSCYADMFQECTGLTNAPALPATELTSGCYEGMFRGCTSLTTAPALPAKSMRESCYFGMFQACTGLTVAPELPAKALYSQCYSAMFANCTSLTTVPALPATTLKMMCYDSMFSGCTSLKLSATQTGNYTQAYRIPTSGFGTEAYDDLIDMFAGTGGTFTGTPEINTTYYLDASNSIV